MPILEMASLHYWRFILNYTEKGAILGKISVFIFYESQQIEEFEDIHLSVFLCWSSSFFFCISISIGWNAPLRCHFLNPGLNGIVTCSALSSWVDIYVKV